MRSIDSSDDYRQRNTARENCYFVPLGDESTTKLRLCFLNEVKNKKSNVEKDRRVNIMMGRSIVVSESISITDDNANTKNIAWLEFNELCESDRGAADYRALCSYFQSIYINNIPKLSGIYTHH